MASIGNNGTSLKSEAGDNIRAYASSKEEQARKLLAEANELKGKASEQDKADDARLAKSMELASKIIPAEAQDLLSRFGSPRLKDKLSAGRDINEPSQAERETDLKNYNLSNEDKQLAKDLSSKGLAAFTKYLDMKGTDVNLFGGLRPYGAEGGTSNIRSIVEKLQKAPVEIKAAAEAYLTGQMVLQAGKQYDATQERDRANTRKKNNQGNSDYSVYHKKEYNSESARIRAEHGRLICEKAIRLLNGERSVNLSNIYAD